MIMMKEREGGGQRVREKAYISSSIWIGACTTSI